MTLTGFPISDQTRFHVVGDLCGWEHSIQTARFEAKHLIAAPFGIDPQKAREARIRRFSRIIPPLPGPYKVGYQSYVLQPPFDPMRDRKIGIEVYSPVNEVSGDPLRFPLDPSAEVLLSQEQLHSLSTYAHPSQSVDETGPVVIFSHGLFTETKDYRILVEQLASLGITVLVLDHPSSSGNAPLHEKEALEALERSNPRAATVEFDRLGMIQAKNIAYVADQMGKRKVVLAGHSLGGAASMIAARETQNISGVVNLDGALIGEERTAPISVPTFLLLAEHEVSPEMEKDWADFGANNPQTSLTIPLPGTNHHSFCIPQILNWLLGDNPNSALKAHAAALRVISLLSK